MQNSRRAASRPRPTPCRRATLWLNVNIVLAVILVCISGVLRTAERTPKPARASTKFWDDSNLHTWTNPNRRNLIDPQGRKAYRTK